MQKKFLTPAQNACAARIFLNIFGLALENVIDIDEYSKMRIYDKDMNMFSEYFFDNGKTYITTNYDNSFLEANYVIPKVVSFINKESNNALFDEWFNKIEFNAENSHHIKLSGKFLISCSVDSEFGIKCLCYQLINCEDFNKGKITLEILRNGRTFDLEASSENYNETIDVILGMM